MSGTVKYGRETVSPGPRPRSCTPTAGGPSWVCTPDPSSAARSSSAVPSSPDQKARARARSSAGNSMRVGRAAVMVSRPPYAARAAAIRSRYQAALAFGIRRWVS